MGGNVSRKKFKSGHTNRPDVKHKSDEKKTTQKISNRYYRMKVNKFIFSYLSAKYNIRTLVSGWKKYFENDKSFYDWN